MKFEADDPSEVTKAGGKGVDRTQGAARAISVSLHFCPISCRDPSRAFNQSFIDPGLSWNDIPWFKSITKSMSVLLPQQSFAEDMIVSALDSKRCSMLGGELKLAMRGTLKLTIEP